MLSAAVSVLLAAPPLAALADVTIKDATTTGLATTASGNITIESTGSIALKNNGAVLSLDSNNFINNSGLISNLNNSGSIGIQIDTTDHNVIAASPGLQSTNAITITGEGTNKVGVLVTGGQTYFGNIAITNTTGVALNGGGATIVVQGDGSSAFRLTNGTKIDGDVSFGGSITGTPGSATSTVANTLFLFDGITNGNVYFDSTTALSNIGSSARGVVVLGGINSCASDSAAVLAAGYTCPSGNGKGLGALINAGRLVTVGQVAITSTKDTVLEGGSVVVIGNSIQGGFYNTGPATAMMKGEALLPTAAVGDSVEVSMLATMVAPWPTEMVRSLAPWAMMTALALPPLVPLTLALMMPGVVLLMPVVSARTSRRGT